MAICRMCHKPIKEGMDFCSECEIKRVNQADESYLDSLLSSVSEKTAKAPTPISFGDDISTDTASRNIEPLPAEDIPVIEDIPSTEEELPVIEDIPLLEEEFPVIEDIPTLEEELPVVEDIPLMEEELPVIEETEAPDTQAASNEDLIYDNDEMESMLSGLFSAMDEKETNEIQNPNLDPDDISAIFEEAQENSDKGSEENELILPETMNIETEVNNTEEVSIPDLTDMNNTIDEISPFDISSNDTTEISPFDVVSAATDEISPFDITPAATDEISPFDITPAATDEISPFDITPAATDEISPFDITPAATDEISPFDITPDAMDEISPFDITPAATDEISPFDITPDAADEISPFDITPDAADEISPFDIAPAATDEISPFDIAPAATDEISPFDAFTTENADTSDLDIDPFNSSDADTLDDPFAMSDDSSALDMLTSPRKTPVPSADGFFDEDDFETSLLESDLALDNIMDEIDSGEFGEAADSSKTKKKKKKKKKDKRPREKGIKGLFKAVFGNIERTPEEIQEEKDNEEKAKQDKINKAAQKKAQAEVKKEEKKKQAEEAKADKENKKKDKELIAAEKKKKKAEEKQKKKEAKLALLAEEVDEGKINKLGASILFAILAIFTVVVIIGTKLYSYNLSIKNAQNQFDIRHYNEAYHEVYGLDIQDADIELYDRIMTVMYVNTQLNSYSYYMTLNEREKALNSLLKGLQRYDKYYNLATILNIKSDLNYVKANILNELSTTFELTEEESYAMIAIDDTVDYSEYIYDLLGSYEVSLNE